MGASESVPFNYEEQLLSDTSALQSVEVEDPQQPANAGKPRRFAGQEKELISVPFANEPGGGCPTVYDCFLRGVKKFPNNKCFGTRVYDLDADGAKYVLADKLPVRGEYQWETYAEASAASVEFGQGLVAMGIKAGSNVGIFSSNRTEWQITAFGLYSQNMRVVALYASLGENAVEYIVNHADINVVCVSKQNLGAFIKGLPKMKGVKHVIQFDADPRYKNVEEVVAEKDVAACQALGVNLVGFNAVKKQGRDNAGVIFPNPAKPSDIAYIMYTSGTTGNPKGAILLHSNIVATVSCVPFVFPLSETDSFLSFLPLAHIFETIAQTALLCVGASIGFFQDNIKKLTADIQAIKPTLFCGVPRVFTRMHQVIYGGLGEAGCVKRWYFNRAFNYQTEQLRQGLPVDPTYDERVFSALRARIGFERVRFIVTGAAPMPPYLAEFLRVVANAPVIEGYGMTEACAATSVFMAKDKNLGHTGPPVPACEVRLEDIPDMGYLHKDQHPRGEICVRGPAVFAGYWKDPENTNATIVDGWLHTGDVGRFNPNGTLSIIDRKKNMFKLSQGEYVASEKIEQTYAKSPMAGQVWVYGNSFKSFLLGVVVPSSEPLAAWLHSKGWWPYADKATCKLAHESFVTDFQTAVAAHEADVKAYVVGELKTVESSLKGFEKVMDWIIETGIDKNGMSFTESNECLTPTFKLRRPQLLQRYILRLKQMYGKNGEEVKPDEKWPGEAPSSPASSSK